VIVPVSSFVEKGRRRLVVTQSGRLVEAARDTMLLLCEGWAASALLAIEIMVVAV
jgi:hypothetical protein